MGTGHTIESVKIYGERNTGTTFVRDIVKHNFAVALTKETLNSIERTERRRLTDKIPMSNWHLRAFARDRFETLVHDRLLKEGFGWKHMNPPVDLIRAAPEMAAKILFVVVVKHPVFWALSFQRRPYHTFVQVKEMPFSEFIRHPFVPGGRDNVDGALYDSIVEIYGAKIDGYKRLSELGLAYEFIRYEDLLLDVSGFIRRLEQTHGLVRRGEAEMIREDSTKRDGTTLAEYRAKYRLDRVKDAVTPEDYDFIVEKFGAGRLAWLGYPDAQA